MKQVEQVFRRIKRRFDHERPGREALICKQGSYLDSVVIKLQKPSWTNDRMDRVPNETGVFFSVWVDDASARRQRANYNIHAFKLRHLRGYTITSRDFAAAFRAAFASGSKAWPNVSVKYGPLTLMQGWIEIDSARFEDDVLALMERFEQQLSHVIDRLLSERVTSKS